MRQKVKGRNSWCFLPLHNHPPNTQFSFQARPSLDKYSGHWYMLSKSKHVYVLINRPKQTMKTNPAKTYIIHVGTELANNIIKLIYCQEISSEYQCALSQLLIVWKVISISH